MTSVPVQAAVTGRTRVKMLPGLVGVRAVCVPRNCVHGDLD